MSDEAERSHNSRGVLKARVTVTLLRHCHLGKLFSHIMDLTLFRFINGLAGQWLVADEFFRFFANDYMVPSTLIAILVMGWFTAQERWRKVVLHALFGLLIANLLVKLCNLIWFRPRPFAENEVNMLFYYPSDSAFPSNSAAVVWCIAWAIWQGKREEGSSRRLSFATCFLAGLMGLSRIWVGVHYPFDIVGGAALGIFVMTLVERYHIELHPLRACCIWLAQKLGLA